MSQQKETKSSKQIASKNAASKPFEKNTVGFKFLLDESVRKNNITKIPFIEWNNLYRGYNMIKTNINLILCSYFFSNSASQKMFSLFHKIYESQSSAIQR